MPLPITPPLGNGDVYGLANLKGSEIAPWFNSGQIKAILELLNRYTADVVLPYVDSTASTPGALDEEAVNDAVAALLVAGTNVTLDYNDAANSLTINSSGGGGSGNSYFPGGW